MRYCLASLVLLVSTIAEVAVASPSCPHAKRDAVSSCPYAKRDIANQPSQRHALRAVSDSSKKGVFLMNRIGPSSSTLWLANADGTNARRLLGNDSAFEYHASFSSSGDWVTFTSERDADGNSDIWRSHTNGTGLQKLLGTSAVEEAAVLSPDGTKVAYLSTANGYRSNIWVMDLATGVQTNLTNTALTAGNASLPDGHFRPSWSPDGKTIAFSSDRNTPWRGHGNGTGWEHTQALSIYLIDADGSNFRQLATKSNYCLGSPKWSIDGQRIVYYEILTEDTWNAHRPESVASVFSEIVSVDVATGLNRTVHVSGTGLKMFPQFLPDGDIGYLLKGATAEGIYYTSNKTSILGTMRSPAWSADGKTVVYEILDTTVRSMEQDLYSWDSEWEYRFTDVFPELSNSGRLAITEKQLGNSSIVTMDPDNTDHKLVFDTSDSTKIDSSLISQGLAGAFGPSWSPNDTWIAFGLGGWFQDRATEKGYIMRAKADGSYNETLTGGTLNSGFPSFSHDGSELVYRVYGSDEYGLRILNIATNTTRVFTTEKDNLPHYSPNGTSILFTRRTSYTNFDVCTMNPDGTNLRVLTESGANDAHAVWTPDGRILYSSGMYGFRDEAAVYDDTFQPYGQIMSMNADGSNKTMLTDSMWEDSMPLYVPKELL